MPRREIEAWTSKSGTVPLSAGKCASVPKHHAIKTRDGGNRAAGILISVADGDSQLHAPVALFMGKEATET
jgi:hypothetical protein